MHRTFGIAVSPCSNPEMSLEQALGAYAGLGYAKFEAFTSWTKSALDWRRDPGEYLELAGKYRISFSSIHLPAVKADRASFDDAVAAFRFGERLGVKAALFKAADRKTYIEAGKRFLEAVAGSPVRPVLQNHYGTPITSLADYREVLGGISDPRMGAVLEVGHFHTAGVRWPEGAALLGGLTALVHVKDQAGPQSVPFGTGEIDLPGLFRHLNSTGYKGDVVVEMEVKDAQNTLKYLGEALKYIRLHAGEES